MRVSSLLLVVMLLLLAGCVSDRTDDSTQVIETPTPVADSTPTVEPAPEPTPTITPETDDEAVDDDEESPDQAELLAQIDQIIENVIELRGLELLEDVTIEIITPEELRQILEEDVVVEQDEIDLDWMMRLLEDRDTDLEQILIDLQAQEILGFYDVEERATFVVSRSNGDLLSPMEEVILAHEIVHALQDQHADLTKVYDEEDVDGAMAFRSVVEGDAVLAQELYALRFFTSEQQMAYIREAMLAMEEDEYLETMDRVPDYIIEILIFPYYAGPQLALRAYDGSFDRINELLLDPPLSTRQVMNPTDYLAGEVDDPVSVEMADFAEFLGDDWEPRLSSVAGQFLLSLILTENGVVQADAVTSGVAGAQYGLYGRGDDLLLVLSSVWDSPDAAAEFEAALNETMDGYDEHDQYWYFEGRYHAIIVFDDRVDLYTSTDLDALTQAAGLD